MHRGYIATSRSVDRAVTELMVTLHPDALPVFRGLDADEEGRRQFAARATGNRPDLTAVSDIDVLYDSGSLLSLAGLRDSDGLALLDGRWRRWCELAERAVADMLEELPTGAELPGAVVLRSLLLAAAADSATAARLAVRAERLATRRNLRVWWFHRLANSAVGDDAPAYQAIMVLAEPSWEFPRIASRMCCSNAPGS